jgi:hypothetical protein
MNGFADLKETNKLCRIYTNVYTKGFLEVGWVVMQKNIFRSDVGVNRLKMETSHPYWLLFKVSGNTTLEFVKFKDDYQILQIQIR